MKARLLKKILNTPYNIADYGDCIGIGNAYLPKLISLNKVTLAISYSLDTFKKGRGAIEKPELLFIWDKMHELVASGKIRSIIDGTDIIENPLPVFSFINGELLETTTDAYGWPNVTSEGYMMYDNGWFKTKKEAIEYGIKECTGWEEFYVDQLKRLNEERNNVKKNILAYRAKISHLNLQLNNKKQLNA